MTTRVEDIMSTHVVGCRADDRLNKAAQIMWEHDCGSVPVVDEGSRVVGIITDRDMCMAAYTQGKSLIEIPVSSACSHEVQTCSRSDTITRAEELMTRAQVRRLPVVDDAGVLAGMLSMSDLAHHLKPASHAENNTLRPRELATVLEAVSRPRQRRVTPIGPLNGERARDLANFDPP